jgi:hypothetical protein
MNGATIFLGCEEKKYCRYGNFNLHLLPEIVAATFHIFEMGEKYTPHHLSSFHETGVTGS